MRGWLKRIFYGDGHALPNWVRVGHADPESQVRVELEGLGEPIDVTGNNVTVDLIPLTLAICLEGEDLLPRLQRATPVLTLRDPEEGGRELGRVRLSATRAIPLRGRELCLFETPGCSIRCLPRPRLELQKLYSRVEVWLDHNPHNVDKMAPSQLFCNWLLYALPRPVTFVSFASGKLGNLFPMDLIGTTDSPYFLLSLRTADPALAWIRQTRELAVSAIPLDYTPIAYALGKNHRVATIDWGTLPFETTTSKQYGIPVPARALSVREVHLEELHELDRHSILVTRTTHFEKRCDGLQMCHTPRIYQQYLSRRGRALPLDECPLR